MRNVSNNLCRYVHTSFLLVILISWRKVNNFTCTDVTLDETSETLKINHNHRKSLARKKKLQAQRLKELQKVDRSPTNDNSSHAIKVSYLGAITLDSKSSDLLALQKPLKSLYFKHVIAQQAGLEPVQGHLQITKTGLKVSIINIFVQSIVRYY